MARRETLFIQELKKAADELGLYLHKLPDSLPGGGIRFSPIKRYDLYIIKKPKAIACEVKSCSGRFDFSCLRDFQIEWLEKYEEITLFPALVIINVRDKNKGINRVFYISILDLLDVMLQVKHKYKRKSVNLELLEEYKQFKEIKKVKIGRRTVWNIGVLLGGNNGRHNRNTRK
jgi:hypothetical protein